MATPRLGLEIPAFGALAALDAINLGATRIELNAHGSYGDGGLTPTLEDLKQLTSACDLRCPLRIMIRPRGPPGLSSSSGAEQISRMDFVYSDEEFDIMEASIKAFRESGLLDASRGDGFVFGILEEDELAQRGDGTRRQRCWVDEVRCTRLVRAAQPFKCVFHRAFDEIVSCDDISSNGPTELPWEAGLDAIATCGFNGILTSGGLGRAIDNLNVMERIIRRANAPEVEIIVGGGVRTRNVEEIVQRLALRDKPGSVYLHSACLYGDGREYLNPDEAQGMLARLR
ncbi:hypothetical protein F4802DRAFT_446822 [Xylaria palmicola]|nr:hypothetical protein F4802DRAFT_446822 [Xylaria palmicola]